MYKLVLDHQKYVTVICNLDGFGYHKYSHHQIYLSVLLYLPLNICTVVLVIVSFLEALIAGSVVTDYM